MHRAAKVLLSASWAIFGAAAPSFCSNGGGWQVTWADEFDGDTLDPNNWNIQVGDPIGSCRYAYCSANNVAVANGTLILTSRRESSHGFAYTTGAVDTSEKQHWVHTPAFRVCASARLPGNSSAPAATNTGLWPALWMMPDMPGCDPDMGEMDILEMISGEGTAYATYHWQTTYPKENCSYPKGHKDVSVGVNFTDWDAQFHEYAVERAATYVAYVYDGIVVLNRSSSGPAPAPMLWPVPFYFIANTAIGGSWPGNATSETVFPVQHIIDYVRVAQLQP